MNVTAVQFDIFWENPAGNFAAVMDMFEKSPPQANTLVTLPEMFATGFSMNTTITVGACDETRKFLAGLARRFGVSVCGGLVFPGPDEMPKNQAIIFDPTGLKIASATKLHPFTKAGEENYYKAGSDINVIEHLACKLAVLICYDLRFPESFRKAARNGAEVFIVPANWPGIRREHWLTLLRARAIENQAYVVGVNRTGHDPNNQYSGDSLIIDPHGETIAQAGEKEGLISADLDIQALRQYRKEFPVLADMKN